MVGDVILLKRAVVHRFDGRSLNVYEQGEIVVNPVGDGAMGLREWWEVLRSTHTSGAARGERGGRRKAARRGRGGERAGARGSRGRGGAGRGGCANDGLSPPAANSKFRG